jgi:hypothetical protein
MPTRVVGRGDPGAARRAAADHCISKRLVCKVILVRRPSSGAGRAFGAEHHDGCPGRFPRPVAARGRFPHWGAAPANGSLCALAAPCARRSARRKPRRQGDQNQLPPDFVRRKHLPVEDCRRRDHRISQVEKRRCLRRFAVLVGTEWVSGPLNSVRLAFGSANRNAQVGVGNHRLTFHDVPTLDLHFF